MSDELNNLNYTIDKYNEVIEDSNLKLQHLKELFKFDYDAYLEEKFKLEDEIKALEKAKLVPYFARTLRMINILINVILVKNIWRIN